MIDYSRAIGKAFTYLMVSGVVAVSYIIGYRTVLDSKERPTRSVAAALGAVGILGLFGFGIGTSFDEWTVTAALVLLLPAALGTCVALIERRRRRGPTR